MRFHPPQQQAAPPSSVVQSLPPLSTWASIKWPLSHAWGLPIPGIAIGIALTLAFQLILRRMGRYKWARHLLQALDLSSIEGEDPGDPEGGEIHRMSVSSPLVTHRGALWGSRLGIGRAALLLLRRMRRALLFAFVGDILTHGKEDDYKPETSPRGPQGVREVNRQEGRAEEEVGSSSSEPPSSPSSSKEGQLEDLSGETVEWVNMCWRKVWRVYQKGLAQWIVDLLQPVLDSLVKDGLAPKFVHRLKIVELTLDHEAPYFSNMRRRNSRKDSDLTGVVDLRYTGGARLLLMLEVGEGRWKFQVPVLISDLDMECQLWMKLRLAPICPWIGTISMAFVGQPNVKVQLSPYNRVRLMRVPVVQTFLRKLFTYDLPGLMVLPLRLEIGIPPSVTSVAEAAVGRDTIMRAVASAVLQADAVEQALVNALPLGPMAPAGGITLPQSFKGELSVNLKEARNLKVWGFPGQSNPYCRVSLGEQTLRSRSEDDTSHPGVHRAPVWNQEFQFLVKDPSSQLIEIEVRDSSMTGRAELGHVSFPLSSLPCQSGSVMGVWLPVRPPLRPLGSPGASFILKEDEEGGELLMDIIYTPFVDDEDDSGYREARRHLNEASLLTASLESFSSPSSLSTSEIRQLSPFQTSSSSPSSSTNIAEITKTLEEEEIEIKDYRSATAASSRAAVAVYAAYNAIAMTQAAAARAAMRAARSAQQAAVAAAAALQFQANADQKKEVEEYENVKDPVASSSSPALSSDSNDGRATRQDVTLPPLLPLNLDTASTINPSVQLSSSTSPYDLVGITRDIVDSNPSLDVSPLVAPRDRQLLNAASRLLSQDELILEAQRDEALKAPGLIKGERGSEDLAHVALQQVWGLVDWAKGILPQGNKTLETNQGLTRDQQVTLSASPHDDTKDNQGNDGKDGGSFWSRLPFRRSDTLSMKMKREASALDSMEEGAPEGSRAPTEVSSSSGRPWWMLWGRQGSHEGDREVEEATEDAKRAVMDITSRAEKGSEASGSQDKPWWMFWSRGDDDASSSSSSAASASNDVGGDKGTGSKQGPLEAVYLPTDLSMGEIAKELAKIKETESKSRDDEMGQLWSEAVEKNDRSWNMVLCFLLTTAVGLLSIVAYKLDVLKRLGIIDREEISPGELIAGIKQPVSAVATAPDVTGGSSSPETVFTLEYELDGGQYRLTTRNNNR